MSTGSLARVENTFYMNEGIHLSGLLSTENIFLPIFTIPSELLEIIFIRAARDSYEDARRSHLTSRIPTCVNVSYVCQHWRNVALNSPTLWTYHCNLSLRWMGESLIRSRLAPLKITCTDPGHAFSWWSSFLDNLRNHSGRIQELRLLMFPSPLPDEFLLRAPRLEILEIEPIGMLNERLAIADAGTPVLRTIKLTDCSLQWHLLNLSKLETLSVRHGSFVPDEFDFVELLTALRSMQNLTTLRLDNVIPDDVMPSGDYGVSHKIDLPQLDLLEVNARPMELSFLFSCIEIPLKTQIRLRLRLEHDTPAEDYTPISLFLTQRLSVAEQSSSSGPIARSLIVHLGVHTAVTLSSLEWDCHSPPLYNRGELNRTIPLQITFGASGFDVRDDLLYTVMVDICHSFSLTKVQTLSVQGDGLWPWKFKLWRELFECLDDLRYLKLERNYMPNLSILSLAAPEPGMNVDGQPAHDQDPMLGHTLVPALEKVELYRIQFLPEGVGAYQSGMSQKSFFDILSTRNGLRDRVIMNECGVSMEY